ncbi:MAG: thiol peroxidase [Marinilabiliales bacterium]
MSIINNNIYLAGKKYTLSGNKLKVGEQAKDFVYTNQNLNIHNFYSIGDITKFISVFPSIDTGVCAAQNTYFNNIAKDYKRIVKFIAISVDLPFALKRFTETNCLSNILMISDYNFLDFGKKYNMIISELRLLTRAVIIIDEQNVIRYIQYINEITEHPDYDEAISELNRILKLHKEPKFI